MIYYININVKYVKKQLVHIIKNSAPPAYQQIAGETVDSDWNIGQLTDIQKGTLGV